MPEAEAVGARAWAHVDRLCRPELAGRAPGTDGHRLAADYLAAELSRIGLRVERQPVPLTVGGWLTEPNLAVAGRRLAYRTEFHELRAPGSRPGAVAGPVRVLCATTRHQDLRAGEVLLLAEPPRDLDLGNTLRSAARAGAGALLVAGGPGPFTGKAGATWSWRDGDMVVLRLADGVAKWLGRRTGAVAEADLPYGVRRVRAPNILGLHGDRSSTRTLLLVAHYDHVGDDPGGWRFPGALDNASGVGVVLAVLPRLMRAWPHGAGLGALFTTGEELGLRGARWFACHPPLPLERVSILNLDAVGADPRANGFAIGGPSTGRGLRASLARIAEAHGMPVHAVDQPTDHRAFEGAAADVADISESAGHIRVHVPEDEPKGLPTEGLDLACTIVMEVALAWARACQPRGWRS